MKDKITLLVGGTRIDDFLSYRVESDLFIADDTFELNLGNSTVDVQPGDVCRLYVNDQLELTGIIDRVKERYDKSTKEYSVEGRDLMGLLVDAYCEESPDIKNIGLKDLAEKLLANIPFINRKAIIYGKGSKLRSAELVESIKDFEFSNVTPVKTVFDVLKTHALSRGLLFYSLPNGTFVFGRPLTSGRPDFYFITRKNGEGNNILEGERIRDISKRYKTVKVSGQQQGTDAFSIEDINVEGSAVDDTFPFDKLFKASVKLDGKDPDAYARILLDKQQFDGHQLTYTVDGHSQNGKNYQVNSISHIIDEALGINADMLMYSRSFTLSKNGGPKTTVKLSNLGVLPA